MCDSCDWDEDLKRIDYLLGCQLRIVGLETSVILAVPLTLFPSVRAVITWTCFWRGSLFIGIL